METDINTVQTLSEQLPCVISSSFAFANFLEPTLFSVCWLDPWRQNPQIRRAPCPPLGALAVRVHPPKPPVPDLMGRRGGGVLRGRPESAGPALDARSGRAPWTDCVERLPLIHHQLSAEPLLPCAGRAFTGRTQPLWQKPGLIPRPPGLGCAHCWLRPGRVTTQVPIGCAPATAPLATRALAVSIPGCLSGSALRRQGAAARRANRE